MKLISFIVAAFMAQLLCGVNAVPAPQLQIGFQQPTGQPEAITAQGMNSGIAFTQNLLQLLGLMFSNFNAIVPRFVGLFTQNQGAANPTGQNLPALPSLSSIPGMPSLPTGFNNRLQPEKVNADPNSQAQNPKRDVEPVENAIGDNIDKILF